MSSNPVTLEALNTLRRSLEERLEQDWQLTRMSGDAIAMRDHLEFLSQITSLNVIELALESDLQNALDKINGNQIYGETYLQGLVYMLVANAEFVASWEKVSSRLREAMSVFKDSAAIPDQVAGRLDEELISDPYTATLWLLQSKAAEIITKEARKNVK